MPRKSKLKSKRKSKSKSKHKSRRRSKSPLAGYTKFLKKYYKKQIGSPEQRIAAVNQLYKQGPPLKYYPLTKKQQKIYDKFAFAGQLNQQCRSYGPNECPPILCATRKNNFGQPRCRVKSLKQIKSSILSALKKGQHF